MEVCISDIELATFLGASFADAPEGAKTNFAIIYKGYGEAGKVQKQTAGLNLHMEGQDRRTVPMPGSIKPEAGTVPAFQPLNQNNAG